MISGGVNVAKDAIEKTLAFGGIPITASDSNGFIYDAKGIDAGKLAYLMELKNVKRGRISEYAETFGCKYLEDALQLVANGCKLVAEGANMPTTPEAILILQKNNVLYAPGKATNAGGVATSGLEMSQNSIRMYWTREEVESRLRVIMQKIHEQCIEYGKNKDGSIDYVKGANIAGFVRVADAMLAEGHV